VIVAPALGDQQIRRLVGCPAGASITNIAADFQTSPTNGLKAARRLC
jgi:hypothetical protein